MTSLDELNRRFEFASKQMAVYADAAKQGLIGEKWLERNLNLATLESVNAMFEKDKDEDWVIEVNEAVWDIIRTYKEAYKYFADAEYYEEFTDDFIEKWYEFYISESLKKS